MKERSQFIKSSILSASIEGRRVSMAARPYCSPLTQTRLKYTELRSPIQLSRHRHASSRPNAPPLPRPPEPAEGYRAKVHNLHLEAFLKKTRRKRTLGRSRKRPAPTSGAATPDPDLFTGASIYKDYIPASVHGLTEASSLKGKLRPSVRTPDPTRHSRLALRRTLVQQDTRGVFDVTDILKLANAKVPNHMT